MYIFVGFSWYDDFKSKGSWTTLMFHVEQLINGRVAPLLAITQLMMNHLRSHIYYKSMENQGKTMTPALDILIRSII